MMRIRHVASLLLAAIWFLAATAIVLAAPTKITFLHTNDVYEISPKGGKGGLAELMTLLKAERAANPNSVTTFGGDLLSPSLMSGVSKGAQMIEIYNALGTHVAVPGNHEYDYGPEIAAKRFAESTFPWLGANVLGPDGKPAGGLQAIRVIEVGGFKVGFFGVLEPETAVLSSPGKAITFASPIETAKAMVKALQEQGAEIVVALTHLSIAGDRELARTVKGIHLALGGHDHDPVTFYENGVLIHKSGYDAHFLGAIDLNVEWVTKGDKKELVVTPQWRMISTTGVAPEPGIKAIVERHERTLDKELGVVIGKTTVELDSRRGSVRSTDTNLGNLFADALRAGVGADVAIINGGGLRGDKTYPASSELTRKDILSELPFGNVTVLLEAKGSDLLAALENGVSQVEDGAGRFPQISGMNFVFDPKAEKGKRIVEVKVGGQPLDPAKLYRVATNDYMAGGGDGYAALKNGKVLIDASGATLMATTVMDYIQRLGTVSPVAEGRIVRH